MVRTKQVGASVSGKGKGVASSSRQGREEEIVEESEHDSMEEDGDEDSAPLESRTGKREKRRKRRTPEEMEADAKLDWVESIPLRGFKSERQVSRRSFVDDNDIIIKLENQGLRFWTRALLGYNEAGVIEFYQNLGTSEALAKGKINSKVNNKKIVVDAKAIAKYLRDEGVGEGEEEVNAGVVEGADGVGVRVDEADGGDGEGVEGGGDVEGVGGCWGMGCR
ncbi:hypothetical protein RHGRI_016026 [Rhododendron griersonianum]|uniref:Uncharacterized protein n=1 Tax=Rhododendron griersonianum TaxID=479676 RepID=A0AAV6JSW0_9ERIC|nr:hypothetical protein RHGRI_016026 [Rhododendron griersonianum]